MMYPIRRDTVFSFLSNWANTSSVLIPSCNAFLMDSSLVETNFQKDNICFMFQVSSFRFQVSSFRFQVSGFKFQVSGFKFQVSGFKFQVSSLLR